jgi:hypothetical protein
MKLGTRELGVAATPAEIAVARPGDELLPAADVVMDRAFDVAAPPAAVWPWIAQLGKGRGGWYLPRRLERLLPRRNRATRTVEDRWQHLAVGAVIPDYGLRDDDTFTVARIDAPRVLLYTSRRGRTDVTWSITLEPTAGGTRVSLRLRLHPVKRVRLAATVGGLFDLLTIAGMAAGLRERVTDSAGTGAV